MEYSASPRVRQVVGLLLLTAFGAVIGFAWSEKDYVAAFAVGVVALGGLWGYHVGALRICGAIGGVIAACRFAPLAAPTFAAKIHGLFTDSRSLEQLVMLGVTSLAIVCAVASLAKSLSRRWSKRGDGFQSVNRTLGFGMGICQGSLVTLILLSGVLSAAPIAKSRLQLLASGGHEVFARGIAQQIVDVAKQTRASSLGPLVEQYNPFEHVQQLKEVQRSVEAMQDPQVVARISNHPALVKLQNKPSIRAAMDALAYDPELREIAMSGKPMNGQIALNLLDNPAIAKLLMQPEILRDIAQAISEMDQNELKSLTSLSSPAKK